MIAEAAKKAKLSHGSVSESSVLKHPLDFLDSNWVIDIFISAGFNDHGSRTITHLLEDSIVLSDGKALLPVVGLVSLVFRVCLLVDVGSKFLVKHSLSVKRSEKIFLI
jgi:hypothetical protein